MRRRMRISVVVLAVVSACGFSIATLESDDQDEDDIGTGGDVPVDAYVPDAGPCQTLSAECAGPTLRTCTATGVLPTDRECGWGCSSAGTAHCARLQPSGGAVTAADLDPVAGLADATINGRTINSDTGEISGVRAQGSGLISGIDFKVAHGVGIFRFNKLTFQGAVSVRGTNAVAFVSLTTIDAAAEIDVRGDCSSSNAGPGGRAGGAREQSSTGAGAGGNGTGNSDKCSGGGGGGFGAPGGVGAKATNAGGTAGDSVISMLYGGGGGGGGGGDNGGRGGGGGGAIQLVANGKIHIEGLLGIVGGINAGGCGGEGAEHCGGGGGAGGTILIEAPIIELASCILAVNGGGGGGSKGGKAGADGRLSSSRAVGGDAGGGGGQNLLPAGTAGGRGGDGGARASLPGRTGENQDLSGAGGGGVGRIRFHTYTGSVVINAGTTLSPSLTDTNTTTTRGVPVVQ